MALTQHSRERLGRQYQHQTGVLDVGRSVTGQIAPRGDRDWFRTTLTAGQE